LKTQDKTNTQLEQSQPFSENPNESPLDQLEKPKNKGYHGGQPTKFNKKRADLLLKALRAGLTKAQACLACGISRQTLATWCEKYPDFGLRVDAAREEARQDALESIRDAGKEDWKALAQWLRLAFPEYRTEQRHTVQLNAQTNILCDEETRAQIIEMRRKLLGNREELNRSHELNGHSQTIDAEIIAQQEENANES
jgi:hypothetical protein